MDLLDLAYYFSLFFLPVVFYIFVKGSTPGSYSYPAWYYVLKMWFARSRVRKMQEDYKDVLKNVSEEIQEQPKQTITEDETDTQLIYGIDVKGNSIAIRITLRNTLHTEIYLEFRLSNGSLYRLPSEPNALLCRISSRQWKGQGLNIQILEPFRRLRITYNGLLKNTTTKEIEHIQFHLIWNAASAPIHYPQDADVDILTDAVAREPWRDGEWINLLGSDCGYDQFGALGGFLRGSSYEEDVIFNIPSWRRRRSGFADSPAQNRDFFLFSTLTDGTLFVVGARSLRMGCSQLRYGSILCNNGEVYSMSSNDISLQFLGDDREIPNIFTLHYQVNGKTTKCVVHVKLNETTTTVMDDVRGWEMKIVTAECDVNSMQAHGISTFWYRNRGKSLPLPPPLLTETKAENSESILVTSLSSPECTDVSITGGKGASLALLSSISSSEFVVPEGFVIAVPAFKAHVNNNKNLQEAIENLEEVCHGKIPGNIEEACKSTLDVFKTVTVKEEVASLIIQEMKNLKNTPVAEDTWRWAVRSSAIGEDSDELSAAGQNSTLLGCTTHQDVLDAVVTCWGSIFSFQSVQYRRQYGLPIKSDMAVVVQRMIPADCAGVIFTCHPSSGDPSQMILTSNYGLGESVVSGSADPDTITLSRTWDDQISLSKFNIGAKYTEVTMGEDLGSSGRTHETVVSKERSESLSLSEEQAVRLGKVAADLERRFGNPRDVEWAFYKDKLYLLQSRPITTLNAWTDYELEHEFDTPILSADNIYTRANVGEVMKGAMSALTSSTVQKYLDQTMERESLQKPPNTYLRRVFPITSHVGFLNILNFMYLKLPEELGLDSKVLDLAVFGHPVINESIHKEAIRRNGVLKGWEKFQYNMESFKTLWNNKNSVREAMKLRDGWRIDFGNDVDVVEMYRRIDVEMSVLDRMLMLHIHTTRASVVYQIIAMIVLAEKHKDFTNDHFHDIALLLATNSKVESAEVPIILEQIAAVVRHEGRSKEFMEISPQEGFTWLKANCPKGATMLQKFLDRHGHRQIREFELNEKSWGMDPSNVVSMIQSNCIAETTTKKVEGLSVDETISQLISPKSKITRMILKFIVKKCRVAVAARENTKSELIRTIHKFRLAYRQLAVAMVSDGLIPLEDLIFHFTHEELGKLISSRDPTLVSKAMRRKRLYPQWNKLQFAEIVYGFPIPKRDDDVDLEQIRANNNGIKIQGTPVRQGNVVARACVIIDIKDANQIQPGDILITHSTDIAWSPYFPMLSGVVTELGGLISHGAVVAREYGLPCIVGAEKATKVFKTGDQILLSGKTGLLELVEIH